eukprot:m.67378 g.67378  ORF g.67378 m.67378 type:complete len:58 (+) comp13631_c0_seq3:411-584(+)
MLKSIVFTYSCLCPSSHLFAYMNSAFLLALLVDIASCVSPALRVRHAPSNPLALVPL